MGDTVADPVTDELAGVVAIVTGAAGGVGPPPSSIR